MDTERLKFAKERREDPKIASQEFNDQVNAKGVCVLNTDFPGPFSNCFIGSNVTIGGQGFGFAHEEDGTPVHIPHSGRVLIGNDVYILDGANIARGTVDDTVIEDNVGIDAHVHVAHNCHIGKNTLIAAGAVICGSVHIGRNCFIGVNACIREGLNIGDDVTVGMGSVVTKNIPDGETWVGNPAKKLEK